MTKAAEYWYCIRARPGTQRMARALPDPEPLHPGDYDFKAEHERRAGESIIERQCREEGIEVYMPSFWTAVQHQRTNKLIDRRFPFFVGYVFVNIVDGDFERVRQIDAVAGFLRSIRGPVTFRDEDIGSLMLAEMERKTAFDIDRETKAALARDHRRGALNKRLGLIFSKGRRKKIPLRLIAEQEIDKLSHASQPIVRDIIERLKALDNEEAACKTRFAHLESAA